MPRTGPRTAHRYTMEFKVTVVQLSETPGIPAQFIAHALAIHPFMLPKCPKDARQAKPPGGDIVRLHRRVTDGLQRDATLPVDAFQEE